jgi:hypothetical protein
LPSVREKVLGKEVFTDVLFAEPSLSSATLVKAFAECFSGGKVPDSGSGACVVSSPSQEQK